MESFLKADRQAQNILADNRDLTADDYEALHQTLTSHMEKRKHYYRTDGASWWSDSLNKESMQNLKELDLKIGKTDERGNR